jgi:hypothetical protein
MSALRDITDKMLGRLTAKVVEPPAVPPPVQPLSAFLIANIKSDTKEFLIVFGDYNFAVAKSFAQPVVGLMGDWVSEYALQHPFATMTRGEIIISRAVPQLHAGSTDCDPAATKAAIASADRDTNIGFLFSLLRSGWAREHCVLSNAGVFQMAQERFESRHFTTHRKKYFERFMKMSDVRTRDVAALCNPPAPPRPVVAPVLLPARQVCKNQAYWDALPESEKARMIAEEQSQWMNKYAPAWGNSRRVIDIDIPVSPPSLDERADTDGWKQPPNASERESIERDDWK